MYSHLFESNKSGSFQRVDESHPLDLYSGKDDLARRTLFLISDTEPPEMYSSQIINVAIGKRKDKRWGISFSLIDNKFQDIFIHFCNDIIESSRDIEDGDKGAEYISERYKKWQNMLAKLKGELLEKSVIKGLIGELIFLKNYLIPLYGQEPAIDSWIGPEKTDQDFVCKDIWYEVKSTVSGAESVKITSIEQVDVQTPGELVIVYLDSTSRSDNERISLNSIFKEVYNLLSSEVLKNKLSSALLGLGYYTRPEYDQYCFKYSKTERYLVDKNFPCVRRTDIPSAVISSSYELSVSSINNNLIRN